MTRNCSGSIGTMSFINSEYVHEDLYASDGNTSPYLPGRPYPA